ncbi:MAG: uridine kinase [bacterium]|nr:uridine kinase [bacterium]
MLIIGIAGGTGSGKTTVAKAISRELRDERITIIHQDSYYRDQSHLPFDDRVKANYDHPDSIDKRLLIQHLRELLANRPIEKPVYDFKTHTRAQQTERIEPGDVVIIEGIFTLEDPELRQLMKIKIYVETDADIRFIRRLRRDITERGRTVESVIGQYKGIVRPMHLQFVEPTKRFADIIIPEGGFNKVAIELIVTAIREYQRKKNKG